MTRLFTCALLLASACTLAQIPEDRNEKLPPEQRRLPNGKVQSEEILKADYKKSLDDAAQLVQLSQDVRAELERNDAHLLSLAALKKLDEIDKVSRRLRNRMKH